MYQIALHPTMICEVLAVSYCLKASLYPVYFTLYLKKKKNNKTNTLFKLKVTQRKIASKQIHYFFPAVDARKRLLLAHVERQYK